MRTDITVTVRVKETGWTNLARVLKHGIVASSTNSPADAVSMCADKLIAKIKLTHATKDLHRVVSEQNASEWQVTISGVAPKQT